MSIHPQGHNEAKRLSRELDSETQNRSQLGEQIAARPHHQERSKRIPTYQGQGIHRDTDGGTGVGTPGGEKSRVQRTSLGLRKSIICRLK